MIAQRASDLNKTPSEARFAHHAYPSKRAVIFTSLLNVSPSRWLLNSRASLKNYSYDLWEHCSIKALEVANVPSPPWTSGICVSC